MCSLVVRDLHASIAGKPILKGVDLSVGDGEVHAVMGPNGSGKSTLGNVLMGSPAFAVSKGSVVFNGKNLLALAPYERARLGLFIAFQHPTEVQGLKFYSFLRRAVESVRGEKNSVVAFRDRVSKQASELRLPQDFETRDLNHGLSGGEKKRSEVLQLGMLKPSLALLDEIDSGLDVDSVKIAAAEVNKWRRECNGSIILMTHYKRILEFIKPDFVHVMVDGRVVKSGGLELASEIEEGGYGELESAAGRVLEQGAVKEEFYSSLLKLNKEKAGASV